MLGEETGLLQLHAEVQSSLSAQRRQNAVRLFLFDDLFQNLYRQRLDVNLICNILVRHDRRRIGVDENNLDALFLQGTARLSSRIVELCCLTDNDRAGTNNHNALYIGILRHCNSLLSSCG